MLARTTEPQKGTGTGKHEETQETRGRMSEDQLTQTDLSFSPASPPAHHQETGHIIYGETEPEKPQT